MEGTISSKEDTNTSIDLTQITIRPIEDSDADDLMVWSSDEEVTKFCTWEPYTSKQNAIDFINKVPTTFTWYKAICLQNRAIGSISLCLCPPEDRFRAKTGEIGYILGRRFWNKGIVTEVLKKVSKAVFGEYPHLERLEALTDLENVGSQRVLEKAGFVKEGVLRNYMFIKGRSRNVVVFSLLPSDLETQVASLSL
ncbi:putative N-acetyltransferase [Senna tora]|uniref:Putative N-acetyltransferase n=1 Tax=Senna tora TaxID=362788 RepID=A0A834W2I6_9FABA|nr:putative N-acetyltransferase [Senna tora]